jgi:IclR family pca regulon transcriptional regulator
MGRVLLAAQTDQQLDEYLGSTRLRPLTRHTITDPERLRAELQRVRAQGWSCVDEELEEGLRSLAAPIHDPRGRVVAAVNVSAAAGRGGTAAVRADLLTPLLDTAAAIEQDYDRPLGAGR